MAWVGGALLVSGVAPWVLPWLQGAWFWLGLPLGLGLAALWEWGVGFGPVLGLAVLFDGRLSGLAWGPAFAVAGGTVAIISLSLAMLRRLDFRVTTDSEANWLRYVLVAAVGSILCATLATTTWLLSRAGGGEGPARCFPGLLLRAAAGFLLTGPAALLLQSHGDEVTRHLRQRSRLAHVLTAAGAVLFWLLGATAESQTIPGAFLLLLLVSSAVLGYGLCGLILSLPAAGFLLLAGAGVPAAFSPGWGGLPAGVSGLAGLLAAVGALAGVVVVVRASRLRELEGRLQAERALRDQESLYRAMLDHAPVGLWMQDDAGRIRFVNQTYCAATGIAEERFRAAASHADLYEPDTAGLWREQDAAALARSGPQASALTLRWADGRRHEMEIIRNRLVDAAGVPTGLLGLAIDLTSRHRTEEVLLLLNAALKAAANAVVITGLDGRIEWLNPAFTTLTGYTPADAMGRNPGELLKSGRHAQSFYQEMWQTIRAGRIWRGQVVNRRKDGTLYTEDMTITPMLNPEGAVVRFIAIQEDVSGLVAAQEAMHQSEERYRMIFDRSPMPMWVYDAQSLAFLAVNEAAVEQYGYTRGEFLTLTLESIRPPEDIARLREDIRKRESDQVRDAGEWRHQHKDGKLITVTVHTSPLVFLGRSCRLAVVQNISEKKQLQEQVMRTQRMESIGLLASGIAHDLNNILTPMRLIGPMLRAQVLNPEDQRILTLVDHSAERGAALVRQILAFAHGTGNERGPVQLKGVVRDVALFVMETFPRELQFVQSVPSDLWTVNANPTQIHQVLLNICVNARDAMGGAAGRLELSASNQRLSLEDAALIPGGRAGVFVCLAVTDTGSGIPPVILAHIWEPFFSTKPAGQGTGLGLSMVRGILSSHEGFCAVDSALGTGTTFRIYLPAMEDKPGPSAASSDHPHSGSDELVLIVDDEVMVRDAVRNALLRHGYRTLTAEDGIAALRLLEQHHADIQLLVTDLRMPRMGGERLMTIVRESYPRLKILAFSGDPGPGGMGKTVQPDAFIAKPFALEEFRRVVDRLLHGSFHSGNTAA